MLVQYSRPQFVGISTAQTAAVIQTTVKDPATGNRDDCFLTSSNSLVSAFPPGNSGVGQAAYISGNIAGNALLCMAGCANDFGTGPSAAGNKVVASPGLLIGFGFNGGVNEGSGGTFCPAAGTGFTNSQAVLTYDQAQPICRVEWQHFSSLGTRAATWTSSTASNYLAMAVGFLDHP